MSYNLKQARPIIERCLNRKVPVMLKGDPGIGKSSIVHQISDERSMECQNIKLSQIEPTELAGIAVPDRDSSNKELNWYRPSWLPTKGKFGADEAEKPHLLFLDELNWANDMQQRAAFELILERRLGDHELVDNCGIIAAGNKSKHGVNPMPTPLKNRMVHIEVEVDFNIWYEWATEQDFIDEEILGFLSYKPELLNDYSQDEDAFPSPRTWEFASKMFDSDFDGNVTEENLQTEKNAISTAIGSATANEFFQWYSVYRKVDPEDILEQNYDLSNEDQSFQYAAIFAVLQYLDNNRQTQDLIDKTVNFAKDLPREFQTLFVRSASESNKLWKKLEDRDEFQEQLQDLVDLVA